MKPHPRPNEIAVIIAAIKANRSERDRLAGEQLDHLIEKLEAAVLAEKEE